MLMSRVDFSVQIQISAGQNVGIGLKKIYIIDIQIVMLVCACGKCNLKQTI